MKTVLNHIRQLNISNSIIEQSTGFDAVQLKAFAMNPSEFPIMRSNLIKFFKVHSADKHERTKLNMVPVHNIPSDAHKSSQKPGYHSVKENVWSKGKAALKRLYRGLRGI